MKRIEIDPGKYPMLAQARDRLVWTTHCKNVAAIRQRQFDEELMQLITEISQCHCAREPEDMFNLGGPFELVCQKCRKIIKP